MIERPTQNRSRLKVLAINGSPRARKGATDLVLQRFLHGASASGADTEVLYPARMKIAPCLGELDCWFKHPGKCRHNDDMPLVANEFNSADLVVFATPVYLDTMTAQIKALLDRMVAYTDPYVSIQDGRTVHPSPGTKKRKAVVISVCGYPQRDNFDPLSLTFSRITSSMHLDLLAEFYFPAAHLIFTEPARLSLQLQALEDAGREAAETLGISSGSINRANSDYVGDPEQYVQWLNLMFKKIRSHFNAE